MKRFLLILAACQIGLLGPARAQPSEERSERHFSTGDRHLVGEDLIIRTNETVGNLVMLGGSLDVQGTVEGDVVMVGGSVKVSGEVTGGLVIVGGGLDVSGNIGRDTVVVLGGAEIRDQARLEENAVLIGGPFHISADSRIHGEKLTVPLMKPRRVARIGGSAAARSTNARRATLARASNGRLRRETFMAHPFGAKS